jgi:hypothetical protein
VELKRNRREDGRVWSSGTRWSGDGGGDRATKGDRRSERQCAYPIPCVCDAGEDCFFTWVPLTPPVLAKVTDAGEECFFTWVPLTPPVLASVTDLNALNFSTELDAPFSSHSSASSSSHGASCRTVERQSD